MAVTRYGNTGTKPVKDAIKEVKTSQLVGMKIPVGSGGKLFSQTTDNEMLIGQIKQVIFTTPGERVMLPKFGLNLQSYLFEPLTQPLVDEIRKKISKQFSKYIPNADILKLVCYSSDGEDPFAPTKIPSVVIRMSIRNKRNNEVLPVEFKI